MKNIGALLRIKRFMSSFGQNKKAPFFDEAFLLEFLSLAGTRAIKATNQNPSTSTLNNTLYIKNVKQKFYIFLRIFKAKFYNFAAKIR